MMKNKKGSAIAEAAVVFPVIILSILAVMYMFIYFYDQVAQQTRVHSALRSEAGLICGNMYKKHNDGQELPVYRKGETVYCYGYAASDGTGMLESRRKRIYAEKYLADGAAVVRLTDFSTTELMKHE